MKIEKLLENLESVKPTQNGYLAKCPAHDDKHSSLSVSTSENGKILLYCHAGCSTENIVNAIGVDMSDLWTNENCAESPEKICNPTREHIYSSKDFAPLAKKVIYSISDGDKECCWYRFDCGKWLPGLNGMVIPLYNLGELFNTESDMIIVAEGEKDADTLKDMGYISTTAPNGAASVWHAHKYNKPFVGKDVVVSDNDSAGNNYAKAVAYGVSCDANSVKIIPAKNIFSELKEKGDISDVVKILGKEETKHRLEAEIKNTQPFYVAKTVVANDFPGYFYVTKNNTIVVNASLLAKEFRENEQYKLVRDTNTGCSYFSFYNGGRYQIISEDSVKAKIKRYITKYDESVLKMSVVKEVFENLKAEDDFVSPSDFDNNENIINFSNGILHLDTMELTEHSPDILSSIQLPIEWNPEESGTPIFDAFLDTLTDGDKNIKKLLLQIIGLCISNVKGYRFKKALFLIGKGNTGKTQLKTLVERILGAENCCSVDLSDLENRFGLSGLYGKRLAGSNDMGFLKVSQLKIFKLLTGGDPVDFEQKHKDKFSAKYNGFLWFCANQMPFFGGDRGEWVYDRIIIINCNNQIPEKSRDPFICDKMFFECSGIVTKAIKALSEAKNNNYQFSIPQKVSNALKIYKADNSPAINFFNECCELRDNDKKIKENDKCTAAKIRKVFAEWCRDNHKGYSVSKKEFEREIAEYLGVTENELNIKKNFGRYYCFKLTLTAKKDFVKIYGHDTIDS